MESDGDLGISGNQEGGEQQGGGGGRKRQYCNKHRFLPEERIMVIITVPTFCAIVW